MRYPKMAKFPKDGGAWDKAVRGACLGMSAAIEIDDAVGIDSHEGAPS